MMQPSSCDTTTNLSLPSACSDFSLVNFGPQNIKALQTKSVTQISTWAYSFVILIIYLISKWNYLGNPQALPDSTLFLTQEEKLHACHTSRFTSKMFGILSVYLTFGGTDSSAGQTLRNKLSTSQFTKQSSWSALTLLPFPNSQVLDNTHHTEGFYMQQLASDYLSRLCATTQYTCVISTKISIFKDSIFKS